MSGMGRPEVIERFQQLVGEEMPDLFGMMFPSGHGGGIPPGMFGGMAGQGHGSGPLTTTATTTTKPIVAPTKTIIPNWGTNGRRRK
eukprot:gnl/Chilomastix_caulleri/7335.p1 GENE.gnl/Chilomastix_caulleri/7335~~gnl/Chilomastix_caulleri/7335.p1  ORF type:complete len:86 (+),score=32.96 gnl/Chilomastix_caulleri/7335:72-329(+)